MTLFEWVPILAMVMVTAVALLGLHLVGRKVSREDQVRIGVLEVQVADLIRRLGAMGDRVEMLEAEWTACDCDDEGDWWKGGRDA